MEIIEKFKQSATSPNKAAVMENIVELGVNSVDTVLSLTGLPIPFCSLIASVVKIGVSFREQRFFKKAAYFLLNAHSVPEGDLDKFLEDLEVSEDKKQKGAEIILDIIDRIDTNSKLEVLVNLYAGVAKKEINIETFLRLTNALEKVTYQDLKALKNHHKNWYEQHATDMLASAGLVQISVYGGAPTLYSLNDFGIKMLEVGLKEQFNGEEWGSDKILK